MHTKLRKEGFHTKLRKEGFQMERLVFFNSSTHTPLSRPPLVIFIQSNINTLEVCKFNISMVNNYFILKISCWKIKYFRTFEHLLYFSFTKFCSLKKNKKLTRYYGSVLIVYQFSPINMRK
jgi:hypothetical protein